MIDKVDILRKDFSTALPCIAQKLSAIGTVLRNHDRIDFDAEDIEALGAMVFEEADDLKIIARALYGD